MRDIAFSRTSYRRFGSNTPLARARRFWIRPGRTSAWCDIFVSQTVVPEEIEGKFENALTADSRRVSVDDRKRYEYGSVDADQLMRFRLNESVNI